MYSQRSSKLLTAADRKMLLSGQERGSDQSRSQTSALGCHMQDRSLGNDICPVWMPEVLKQLPRKGGGANTQEE